MTTSEKPINIPISIRRPRISIQLFEKLGGKEHASEDRGRDDAEGTSDLWLEWQ
jgi:hypothetical protein